jgi:hypothetical protein
MFNYITGDGYDKIHVRSGEYNQNEYGYFFKTPGNNWFYQPKPNKELTYLELRRLYNKLYQLNKKCQKQT